MKCTWPPLGPLEGFTFFRPTPTDDGSSQRNFTSADGKICVPMDFAQNFLVEQTGHKWFTFLEIQTKESELVFGSPRIPKPRCVSHSAVALISFEQNWVLFSKCLKNAFISKFVGPKASFRSPEFALKHLCDILKKNQLLLKSKIKTAQNVRKLPAT